MRVQDHNYPFCVYYLTSSPWCFRSILYQWLNVKRTFLMNFKPVLCWEAAWYDICHNTFIRTGETERAGQQVCFSSKVHPSLTTFFTLQIPSFLALCFSNVTINVFSFACRLFHFCYLHEFFSHPFWFFLSSSLIFHYSIYFSLFLFSLCIILSGTLPSMLCAKTITICTLKLFLYHLSSFI